MDHRVWEEDECGLRVVVPHALRDAPAPLDVVVEHADPSRGVVGRYPARVVDEPHGPTVVTFTFAAPTAGSLRTSTDTLPAGPLRLSVVAGDRRVPLPDVVTVYPRRLVVSARWSDGGPPCEGARVRLTQRAGPCAPAGATYTREATTDARGLAEIPLKYTWGDLTLTWLRPHVGEWLNGDGPVREASLTYAPRLRAAGAERAGRVWINRAGGRRLTLAVAAEAPSEVIGEHPVFVTAQFSALGERREGRARLKIEPASPEASVPIALSGRPGERVEVSVGGTDACDDDRVALQAWRSLDVALHVPMALAQRLGGARLPDPLERSLADALAPAFVALRVVTARVISDPPVIGEAVLGRLAQEPDGDALKVLLCDGCLSAESVLVMDDRDGEAREEPRAALDVAGVRGARAWSTGAKASAVLGDLGRTLGLAPCDGDEACGFHEVDPGARLCAGCVARLLAHPLEGPWT